MKQPEIIGYDKAGDYWLPLNGIPAEPVVETDGYTYIGIKTGKVYLKERYSSRWMVFVFHTLLAIDDVNQG